MSEKILEKLTEVIVEQLDVQSEKVTLDANFYKDLGLAPYDLDDLDKVEFVMAIEEAFEVEITDEEAEHFYTVRDLFNLLLNKESVVELNIKRELEEIKRQQQREKIKRQEEREIEIEKIKRQEQIPKEIFKFLRNQNIQVPEVISSINNGEIERIKKRVEFIENSIQEKKWEVNKFKKTIQNLNEEIEILQAELNQFL
ncbi:MAG: acyl carrier protein [Cyanobacterium sp. T60_A2020_053]|nr:acyl carrier protein [Cyanobacterium sp. T60_A2020_053]